MAYMEELEEAKDVRGDATATNNGTGAAVTIVSKDEGSLPNWVYVVGFVGLDVVGIILALAVFLWPRGAQ